MPKPTSSVLDLFKKTANPTKVNVNKLNKVNILNKKTPDELLEMSGSEDEFSEYTEEEEEEEEYDEEDDVYEDEDDIGIPTMNSHTMNPPSSKPPSPIVSTNRPPTTLPQAEPVNGSESFSQMPGSASCMNSIDPMTAKKQFYLAEISRMNYALATRVSMQDTLQHLEFMYNQCRNTADANSTVEFMKEGLRMVCVGLETANEKFGPFLQLNGWSRAVTADMKKFQHPLEEIYRRYWRRGGVSPFLELAMALGSSVMQYHFTGGYGAPSQEDSGMKFDSFSVANSHMGSMRGPANY